MGLRSTNQVEPLVNYNAFLSDPGLLNAVRQLGADWDLPNLAKMGALTGSHELQQCAYLANRNKPVLHTHDDLGNRRDEVEFHPAWHSLMRQTIEHQCHSLPWTRGEEGVHVARAARYYLFSQNEAGHGCPITMTHACIPTLDLEPDLARQWRAKITEAQYDPSFKPPKEKLGLLCGMAMTEKQGGSDVRSNETQATPLSGSSNEYVLVGHKWFCSHPMSDFIFALAQAPNGLTCFMVPRWLPDGTKNSLQIVRLKDKLGNCSNASSEIEFHNTWAQRVGQEGRGIQTIIKMVNLTRLDCVIGSAAIMRRSLVLAVHNASCRRVFGEALINQPLMQNVLADMAIESEAAKLLFIRLAQAYDNAKHSEHEKAFLRIGTALGKYWVCKRTPMFVAEAMECVGGNGYVESSPLPRLYREAPLNSIWEGSGNINALDVIRALSKEQGVVDALIAELETVPSPPLAYKQSLDQLKSRLRSDFDDEIEARRFVETCAIHLQASITFKLSTEEVAHAYCETRIKGNYGYALGTLPKGLAYGPILTQAWPLAFE